MKKVIAITVLAISLAGMATLSYAQADSKEAMMKDGKMCPLKGKMMGGMMGKPSMVASSDGGVIVLKGCKLTKFDKNLNVTKEVTLECDSKQLCPMCLMKMEKGGDAPEAANEGSTE